MTLAHEQGYRQGLVDMKAGQISREIFVNDEIYQQELERLFARVWLFVGHESQIPNPGDYFVSGMGEESVILCRDRAGKVHVFWAGNQERLPFVMEPPADRDQGPGRRRVGVERDRRRP